MSPGLAGRFLSTVLSGRSSAIFLDLDTDNSCVLSLQTFFKLYIFHIFLYTYRGLNIYICCGIKHIVWGKKETRIYVQM